MSGVLGCQEVRRTLTALVAVLVRPFNQCTHMKPLFSLIFCRFCLMGCTCSYSCEDAVSFQFSFLSAVDGSLCLTMYTSVCV